MAKIHRPRFVTAIACLTFLCVISLPAAEPGLAEPFRWLPAECPSIGAAAPAYQGSPSLSQEPGLGAVIGFDGQDDGLFVETNPIEGCRSFTIEALFKSAGGGGAQQRFFHIQDETGRRLLLETRLNGASQWSLDTHLFEKTGTMKTLLDTSLLHPPEVWHWVALVYDGSRMAAYVDGIKEGEVEIAFSPMKAGRLSLGVRLTHTSWFKGLIRELRFHRTALAPQALQRCSAPKSLP